MESLRQARVGSWTVVALHVAVHQRLPVELTIQLVRHVVLVVAEVELVEFLLKALEELAKWHWAFWRVVKVDEDQTLVSDMGADWVQSVLCLVKVGDVLELWGLCKVTVGVVGPAVVETAQHDGGALLLSHHRVRSVTADVVEGLDLALLVLDEEELHPHEVVGVVVSSLLKGGGVRSVQPRLHEYGTLLQVKDLLRKPP